MNVQMKQKEEEDFIFGWKISIFKSWWKRRLGLSLVFYGARTPGVIANSGSYKTLRHNNMKFKNFNRIEFGKISIE